MEKLPLDPGVEVDVRGKINEVIDLIGELTTAAATAETDHRKLKDDFAVACEKIGKLEGENDALKGRADKTEKALFKTIEQLAYHTHGPDGKAAVPLAV